MDISEYNSRKVFTDGNLSIEAKGLYGTLHAIQNGTRTSVNISKVAQQAGISTASAQTLMNELVKRGHVGKDNTANPLAKITNKYY